MKCVLPVFVIIVTSLAMMPFLPGCQAQDCGCPPFWTAFQSHCYRYFSVKTITWLEAEMHCMSFSVPCTEENSVALGHLTSIHSKEEMNFLSALYEGLSNKLTEEVTRVWMGFNDIITEDTWKWSDGTTTDFTQWASDQPNNHDDNQDCAEFQYTTFAYEWHDISCDIDPAEVYAPTAYVCKLPKQNQAKSRRKK